LLNAYLIRPNEDGQNVLPLLAPWGSGGSKRGAI